MADTVIPRQIRPHAVGLVLHITIRLWKKYYQIEEKYGLVNMDML